MEDIMREETEEKPERKMEEVFCDIVKKTLDFYQFARLQIRGGFAANEVGAISRKASMELGALCKEWRKVSNAAYKFTDDDKEPHSEIN